VKTRENLRLARSRAFGMVRRIVRELGRRLADSGRLAAPGDIFYLTVDEVVGEVRGLAVTRDLRPLVELRRRDFDAFAARSIPGRVSVRGLPYARPFAVTASPPSDDTAELRGLGCAGGRVTAPARIVLDPSADLDLTGRILVAPSTDPAWAFLMVSARGIVVERGSPLSHTAIIGRELGIPTVVAVEGATHRIRDGQTIEIDGQAGTVRLMGAPDAAPAGSRATS
jgi:pyruvate,water dikinase